MKTQTFMLKAAGILSVLFIGFHLAFPKLFHWKDALECLNARDYAIFMTYHLICILILVFMLFMSLFLPLKLLNSSMKHAILGLFSMFFFIRIVCEFVFFGIHTNSWFIIALCAVPMILYALPMFQPSNG